MARASHIIGSTERYGARNYHPLPVVISKGEGPWVWDADGMKYLDMLSAYSALNHGHRHPRLIRALKEQADRVTVTSRAFHNDRLGDFYAEVANLTGKDMVLPMNTGVEAVETAVKAARRWAYRVKKVAPLKAEIIACEGNFHGRTLAAISLSSDESYREDFGPFVPGFRIVPYGDLDALREAVNENTAAFLVEPIQGEAGVRIPPSGYLSGALEICRENNVLLMADEIQTGLGRTGKLFACDWEGVVPDIYIMGKALGGGVYPVSAVAASEAILGVFDPGSHGSTFGGNPMAASVAAEALRVLQEEGLAENSLRLGEFLVERLGQLSNPHVREIRGRGLFVGIELDIDARAYCEKLMKVGILAKETHINVIRLAPPLVVSEEDLEWGLERLFQVMSQ